MIDDERSPLLAVLERPAIWGPAPELVRRFDRCAALGEGPRPDFCESSPQISHEQVLPWRMTHYFDVRGRPLAQRIGVATRLSACAVALGIAIPDQLAQLLAHPNYDPALRQLCLGIDARFGGEQAEHIRLKLYAIFEGDAATSTAALCSALGVIPPAAANVALTHIVGVDLDHLGLHDVKLYYALAPRQVTRTLREPLLAVPLLRGCRRVVYQRSLIVERKQSYHFHADSPAVLHAELGRLRAHAPATVELERRHEAIAAAGLAPWILAHPFGAGELDRRVFSLYLHLRERSSD
jgi:hypothetical protein